MTSNPEWGPEGSSHEIALERTFIAGDFLTGMGYARTVQIMYVDNRNYPGGPWQYFLATQNLPVNVMFYATLFVLTFLADLLILWRCWIIWGATGVTIAYVVIAFPALMLLASFVMGTLWTLQSSQPGLSLYSALPMAYGTSYYVISLSVNIILTILIATRLLLYRRKIMATIAPDHGTEYFSLAAIFVESAALYSLFAILFIITYAIDNPINQVFLAFSTAAQQIAGYLIIYRVAEGRALDQKTLAATRQTAHSMDFHISIPQQSESNATGASEAVNAPAPFSPGSPRRTSGGVRLRLSGEKEESEGVQVTKYENV
ncbi:hypothetical protein NLJ89_g10062 [Agrocybe chaxingu]|uniref:Uncharacterized protein n=1 Tax=Agrocybe chaxingu TaxID=84603 RepID=A0A9W8JYV6_9AGAR|nr:hypothetical protein NLJ89_g10062 [Agrocybe chaxingu]